MEIKICEENIGFLLQALKESPKFSRPDQAERLFRKRLQQGWIFLSDVEDILFLLDERLNDYRSGIEDLYLPFGVVIEDIAFKPKKIANSASVYKALRLEYFVLLLIQLERMGFQMFAKRFVNLLLPELNTKTKTILSPAELEIFWYSKFRHKCADVILYTEKPVWYEEPMEKFKDLNGFKVSFYQNIKNPEIQMLCIRAPKFRKRPSTRPVTCSICGLEWYKGDPESSLYHRKEHKRRLSWLNPAPLANMLLELQMVGISAEEVSYKSPLWKYKEMYNRALAFKREFHYDFIQWNKGGSEDKDAHGFLLTGESGEIVGACAFRNRLQEDNSFRWGLQWIWICPNERGKGHLTKRWSMFRERFGDFLVEPPVSDGMKAFLEKQGDSKLMK